MYIIRRVDDSHFATARCQTQLSALFILYTSLLVYNVYMMILW